MKRNIKLFKIIKFQLVTLWVDRINFLYEFKEKRNAPIEIGLIIKSLIAFLNTDKKYYRRFLIEKVK